MSAPQFKVLISGAGIAGPCLAYWLSKTSLNASITIIERSSTPRVTGQAVDIRGAAIEIVKRMKLEEAIRSRTTTEEGTRIVNASGKTVAEFIGDGAFTAEYEILRGDLSDLFLQATKDLRNVRYVYGDHIKSLEQSAKDVNVQFANGSSEKYDLVVAADGAGSKTRPMILDKDALKDSYKFLGQYLAFFSIPSRPNDPKFWQWYNAPKGLALMTRPHRNPNTIGAYLCVTTSARGKKDPAVEAAMDQGTEASKQLLHDYLDNAGWQAKRLLEGMDTADDFYMSRAAQVILPKWTNGRALVIGDAAFATFGVGTSLAIQSTYILAGELSKMQSKDDVPKALENYEKVFRPIQGKMEEIPPGFPQLACPQTSWGIKIRDILISFVSKTKIWKLIPIDTGVDFKLPPYEFDAISEKV